MYHIAVISGSLRKNSTNTGTLRAIIEASKKDKQFDFKWIDIHQFPVFNQDIESKGIPKSVQTARDIIKISDGILFGIPQYNFSISSPLKNAYDWLARDDSTKYCPMTNILAAMISSGGQSGGQKAQIQFRQSVQFRNVKLLIPSKNAQILIKRFSGNIFDQSGNLIDQTYKTRILLFLKQFYEFIRANKKK